MQNPRMTTETYENPALSSKPFLQLISSTEDPALWSHPVLDIFAPPKLLPQPQKAKRRADPQQRGIKLVTALNPLPSNPGCQR